MLSGKEVRRAKLRHKVKNLHFLLSFFLSHPLIPWCPDPDVNPSSDLSCAQVILLLMPKWIKRKHAICCGCLWKCKRCSSIRSFPTLHVSRTVVFWNVLMKAGYTLEKLPVRARATRCALSFSLTPNSQLRVRLICMFFFFLDKEEELTPRSTGKGLTVAPVIKPWPY